MKNNKLICIGKISKPHGIMGDAKVISYAENLEDIFNFPNLFDENENKILIKRKGKTNNQFICSISNVNNRNDIEKLCGMDLYVYREMLKKPKEDEFYYDDLKNCIILNENNEEYAKVIGLHNFGAGDILEIELSNKKQEYIPFSKDFIFEIDTEKKYIRYNLKELGL